MIGHLTSLRRRNSDRRLFLVAAAIFVSIVVCGFAPTWFLRTLRPTQMPLTVLVQVHGALMTFWFALFAAQIILVATHHTGMHRRVGTVGAVTLALIVVTTVPTLIAAARLGGDHMPGPPVAGLAFVAGFLLAFGILAAAGLMYTQRPDIHKRLMLVATVTAMEAATMRLPFTLLHTSIGVHVATDVALLIVVAMDSFLHRRINPGFGWGFTFLVGTQFVIGWIAVSSWWAPIATRIIGEG